MKKNLLYLSLVIFLMSILIPSKKESSTIEKKASKAIETGQASPTIEDNQTKMVEMVNQKPTVEAGDDQNITFGDEVTLEAIAKDNDGNIVSYLWREGNSTLSEEESFSYKFDNGVHHIRVIVEDNKGAKAEDNVTVNLGIWVLDKVIIKDKIIHYEYNRDGKITKTMMDWNHDGKVDYVYYYGYDKEGKESFVAIDLDNDGYIDQNSSPNFTYRSKNGFNVLYRDGQKFMVNKISSEYSDDGKIVETVNIEEHLKVDYEDDNGNVIETKPYTTIEKTKYHYNEENQLVELVSIDNNGSEHIDKKYHYEDGKLVLKEYFYKGKRLSKERYEYEGELLKESKYRYYRDGKVSRTLNRYYNENGLLENDGSVKYLYDENNRVIAEENKHEKFIYFYDNEGNKIGDERYTKNEEGSFEKYWSRSFDGDREEILLLPKHISIINYDYFSKKRIGEVVIYKRRDVYDEHNNLIEIWDDIDGKLIEKRFYRFVVL